MKNLIECVRGPTTQTVSGSSYNFERDEYGRFVAKVTNLNDRAIFLSIEHYKEAPDHPPVLDIPDTFALGLGQQGDETDGQSSDDLEGAGTATPVAVSKITAKRTNKKAK